MAQEATRERAPFTSTSHKREKGGHVLGLATKSCRVQIAVLNRLNLVLPTKGDFLKSQLSGDRSHQLEKVEKDH